MRQKWGLIRAVSVAILFSAVCFLNNGSRMVHTLLELRAAGQPVRKTQANDGNQVNRPDLSKHDATDSAKTVADNPAVLVPDDQSDD